MGSGLGFTTRTVVESNGGIKKESYPGALRVSEMKFMQGCSAVELSLYLQWQFMNVPIGDILSVSYLTPRLTFSGVYEPCI